MYVRLIKTPACISNARIFGDATSLIRRRPESPLLLYNAAAGRRAPTTASGTAEAVQLFLSVHMYTDAAARLLEAAQHAPQ